MIVTGYTEFFALALLTAVALLLNRFAPPKHDGLFDGRPPEMAVYQIVVQLIVAIVFALISAALQPKPKAPEPGRADSPEIEEGTAPVEIFGAVWLNKPFMAGWKQMDPPEPIKQSAK